MDAGHQAGSLTPLGYGLWKAGQETDRNPMSWQPCLHEKPGWVLRHLAMDGGACRRTQVDRGGEGSLAAGHRLYVISEIISVYDPSITPDRDDLFEV